MISILQEQLFRLKKSKLFWVMLGLTAASPLLALLLVVFIAGLVGGITSDVIGAEMGVLDILRESEFIAGSMGELRGYSQLLSDFSLLSLITTSVVLSKEFTDGTMRNVILANKSRKQMYFAYLIVALGVATVYMLANFAVLMLICAPICGFGDLSAGEATSACFCSLALGLFAIAFTQSCVVFFLFTVRKQWATVLLPLLICMFGPGLIETIVTTIAFSQALHGEVMSEVTISWLPLVNAELYNPSMIDGGLIGKIIMYYAIFAAAFTVGGYFIFEKTDLK